MGFLSRCCRGKGRHLRLRGESPGFSRVAAGNMGFLLSYNGDFRDPFVRPQENPVSMRVVRALSGFLSNLSQIISPHLELKPQPQGSSPVHTWISGCLLSFDRGVRLHLLWRHASLLCCRAVTVESGFLSSSHRDLWLSLEVPEGCHTCHRVVSGYSW